MAVSIGPFQNIVNVGWNVGSVFTLEYRAVSNANGSALPTAPVVFAQAAPLNYSTGGAFENLFGVGRIFSESHEHPSSGRTYQFVQVAYLADVHWTIHLEDGDLPVNGSHGGTIEVDTYDDNGQQSWFVVGGGLSGPGGLAEALAALQAAEEAAGVGLDNFSANVTAGAQTDSGSGVTHPPGTHTNTNYATAVFNLALIRAGLPDGTTTFTVRIETPAQPSPGDLNWTLKLSTFRNKRVAQFPVNAHVEPVGWPTPATAEERAHGTGHRFVTFTINLETLAITVIVTE